MRNTKKVFEKKKRGKIFGNKKKIFFIGVICIAIIAGVYFFVKEKKSQNEKVDIQYEMVKVEPRTIVRTVEGSSVVEANDSYNVTSLVKGEILTDKFNEGDIVKKDQVLYVVDAEEAQKKVDSAKNELTKAQQNYSDTIQKKADTIRSNEMSKESSQNSIQRALENVESANRSLSTAQDAVNNLTVKSEYTGVISEVLVEKGDMVSDGTKLARIFDPSVLKVQIPFNVADADGIREGDVAELILTSSAEKLNGVVERVATATMATESNAIVKYVTVTAQNPGALKSGMSVSAVINGMASNDIGAFEYYTEGYIKSETSGEVKDLYLQENDYITQGQVVGYLVSESAQTALKNAQTSVESSKRDLNEAYNKLEENVMNSNTYSLDSSIKSAQISVDNAKLSLETAQKNLEDYTIKAPIDGTIIVKNNKAGDKLEQNNTSSEPMAIIYDMSVLKVQITADESNIHDISVGQDVQITADAVSGMFMGKVTKVGINGTSSNGVTTYPVDIEIAEYGGLLPGMNVDCVIVVEKAENVLAIPVSSLQRGNMVYIKGEKEDEKDRAPEGYRSMPVKTGITDSAFIEIKEGLKEGEEICGALKATGKDAIGAQSQQMSGMPGMGGMPGGMGGNRPMGGMPGGMGGNRPMGGMSGGMGGNRPMGGMSGGMR